MKIKKILIAVLAVVVLLPILFVVSVRLGLFGPLPGAAELKKLESHTAARILSSDGQLIGLYYLQNRTEVDVSLLPDHLVKALIATEDIRFYHHKGIDLRASLRVLVKTLLLFDRSSGGGSTISQQLAKNLFPRKDYGILTIPVAKIREILIAIRLEKVYSKNEILGLYFNTVTFGENTYGIETASLTYFSREPADLSIEESAMLIGLLKASSTYNPRQNPEAAVKRRNTVLRQMERYGFISEKQLDSLLEIPVALNYRKLDHISGPAPYFREYIRQETGKILDEIKNKTGIEYNLYTDGLTVETTLNLEMQQDAEKSMQEHLSGLQAAFKQNWAGHEPWRKDISQASLQIAQSVPYLLLINRGFSHEQALDSMKVPHHSKIFTWQGEKDTVISSLDSILHHFEMLQGGLAAIDPSTGALLAWVGGDDYGYYKYDHVTAHRQAGSTFKPIVYAAAIEKGIDPCKLYSAETETYAEYEDWTPRNYDESDDGYYSLQGALVHSVNTVSVKILMETGIREVVDLAGKLGITSALPLSPSLALGSGDISLLEMTCAYATLLNNGVNVNPYTIEKITDRNGEILYQAQHLPGSIKAMSPSTAEIMLGMLQAVVDRGTGSSLRTAWKLQSALAGKTGTTQEQADAWFIGMTPSVVIGVWTGGDSPLVKFRSGSLGSGAKAALPVFGRLIGKMNKDDALKHYTAGNFRISEETAGMLNCQDFSERRGIRINAKKTTQENFIKKTFGKKKRK